MRLRKECEHGRWETHGPLLLDALKGFERDESGLAMRSCPGGEFLPEGALVIEKVDGEWFDVNNHNHPALNAALDTYLYQIWAHKGEGPLRDERPKSDYQEAAGIVSAFLDALASQVGESE